MDIDKISKYARYRGWDDYTCKTLLPSEVGLVNFENKFISFFKDDCYIDISLKDLIFTLSDPNTSINNQLLGNLIVKYIYSLIYPDTVTQIVSNNEINKVISMFMGRNTLFIQDQFPREAEHLDLMRTGIKKILDLPKTIEVMKEILGCGYNSDEYFGIEFGCGSGLLAFTQLLGGMRNNINNMCVFAIDKGRYNVDPISHIYQNIFGKEDSRMQIVSFDLRELVVYDYLKGSPVSQIVLEQIPSPRQPMKHSIYFNIIDNLYNTLNLNDLNTTQFIFNQIETYSSETDTTYLLNKENRYGYDFVGNDREILLNSYPRKIELNGKMEYLLDIGFENDKFLTDEGLLNLTPRW